MSEIQNCKGCGSDDLTEISDSEMECQNCYDVFPILKDDVKEDNGEDFLND